MKKPVSRKGLFAQTVFAGLDSLIIVFFVDFFIGMVLAMQSAYQLEQLGATIYVAALVGVSITREIGPVLTALVIAGRVAQCPIFDWGQDSRRFSLKFGMFDQRSGIVGN